MMHWSKTLVAVLFCLICLYHATRTGALVGGDGRSSVRNNGSSNRSSTARSGSSTSSARVGQPIVLQPPLFDLMRNDKYDDYRERRRKFVSMVAMGLTGMLTTPLLRPGGWTGVTRRMPDTIPSALKLAPKLKNLSNAALAEIIKMDGRERQFLFTADMTRSVYDESATFKDGSDIDGAYPIDAWVRGCRVLFDAKGSRCKILEPTMSVTSNHVKFRFAEVLQFRAMFRPRVYLTGTVTMKRHPETGLIVHYEENWDQDLQDLIRGLKWGKTIRTSSNATLT